ncbi:MAG: outer membrane protein OmpA-like peptidoglycan-associated protein [Flavobacteriales bacterium]|jgi:outer membrane protein OmpA-like peptidoglycan-associated protein
MDAFRIDTLFVINALHHVRHTPQTVQLDTDKPRPFKLVEECEYPEMNVMKTIPFLLVALLLMSTTTSIADPELPQIVRKAELNFIEYDYFDALDEFQDALKKYPKNTFVMRRIADCYRLMGLFEESKKAYLTLLNVGGYDAMDYFFCAQLHKQLEEYETANFYITQFNQLAPEDSRAKLAMENPEYYAELTKVNPDFTATALEVNDVHSYLPPAQGKTLLILPIAPVKDDSWFPHKRYLANYDLYETTIDEKLNLVMAESLLGSVNTKFSEGPSCYDQERGVLYVTRFLSRKKKPSIDERGTVFSMIASYKEEDGEWYETNDFKHDFGLYSCAYPTISPDGNTLYFSANGEESQGGMDIYTCTWEEGQWSEPHPLDANINTEGDEVYPNFSANGGFNFSSDGHPGLGGLDIFIVDKNGTISNPGMPVNSPNDDFGLAYIEGQYGYFCSNRAADKRGDDLFWWEELQNIIETEIVLMDLDGNPLYPGKIEITNLTTQEIVRTSAQRGSFNASLNGKDAYEFKWMLDGKAMSMTGKPNYASIGLRYIYNSPNDGVFLADARVVSYKQGNIQRKRTPHDEWASKNLTNIPAYALNKTEIPVHYLKTEWNSETNECPPVGSTAYLKDLETGQVQEVKFNGVNLEFPMIANHLHALSWKNAGGEEQVKFLEMDVETARLNFLDNSQDWSLALNRAPEMGDQNALVFPDLVASSEGGFASAEAAAKEPYRCLASADRTFKRANGQLMITAETVYFGFDKSYITEAEKKKLQAIMNQLETFPEIELEIVAFTDSRGSSKYNLWLSKKRAEATRKAFIDLGFHDLKVKVKWVGEGNLLNDCNDGQPCPEKLHLLNRRAEISLILPQ